MRRSKILVATTALGLGLLVSGCGGDEPAEPSSSESAASESPAEEESEATDDAAAYCDDLASAEEQFASFDQGDAAQFEEAIATFRELGAQAPEEVSGDWQTLLGAFDDLEATLNDAGIELGDLEGLSQGEVPEGVDPQELQKLGPQIESLGSPEVEEAGNAIEEHASSECDVDLSGSGS